MVNNATINVIQEVMVERSKQQSYGFDAASDNKYEADELLHAGICYASNTSKSMPSTWPWHSTWWRPRSLRENLIRAIALLVAHVESTDRRTGGKDW